MAPLEPAFEAWLGGTLTRLGADVEVFGPYIAGILDTDDSPEEKKEALDELLQSITDQDTAQLCADILKRWNAQAPQQCKEETPVVPLDEKLVQMLGEKTSNLKIVTAKPKVAMSAEKQAILAQYAEVEEEEEEVAAAPPVKTSNATAVDQEAKRKREESKKEYAEKKEKDKMERDKQKAKADERKEKEKKRTTKGERKR